jgi:hypothetical protein
MHRYPRMRVAYIDNICINRSGESIFYSVLVKSDGHGKFKKFTVLGCLVIQYLVKESPKTRIMRCFFREVTFCRLLT